MPKLINLLKLVALKKKPTPDPGFGELCGQISRYLISSSLLHNKILSLHTLSPAHS